MNSNICIIDCDLFNHLIESTKDITIFSYLINDLSIELVIHEYVYEQELLLNKKLANELINRKELQIIMFDDFIDDSNKDEYLRYFEHFYFYANGRNIQYINNNFRTYRKSKENLGEIHSLCLALLRGYSTLLSNDLGTKKLNELNERKLRITIKNIYEVFDEIAIKNNKRTTKKMFLDAMHFEGANREKINAIRAKWIGE